MTYIIEYIEEHTQRFRAVRVESDSKEYAHIDAMKEGANISKLLKVYPDKEKPKEKPTTATHQADQLPMNFCNHEDSVWCVDCSPVPLI